MGQIDLFIGFAAARFGKCFSNASRRRMSSKGKRGTGSCSNCNHSYHNKYKPSRCVKCDFFIGGSYIPKPKKKKANIPEAVQITEHIFSVRTTYRNDRCLVSRNEDGQWVCLNQKCKEKRATFYNSGIVNIFRYIFLLVDFQIKIVYFQ
jgi:hypothetical protein